MKHNSEIMGTLRELNARVGDTVQVIGGSSWIITKVDHTGFYVEDPFAPKLSNTLEFRIIKKGEQMTIRDPSSQPLPVQLWVHQKSGHHYKILHHGLFEGSLKPMVIYQSYDDDSGPVWVRPAEQFFDGRFRNWE